MDAPDSPSRPPVDSEKEAQPAQESTNGLIIVVRLLMPTGLSAGSPCACVTHRTFIRQICKPSSHRLHQIKATFCCNRQVKEAATTRGSGTSCTLLRALFDRRGILQATIVLGMLSEAEGTAP